MIISGGVLTKIIEIISIHNNEIHIKEIIEELVTSQSKSEKGTIIPQ